MHRRSYGIRQKNAYFFRHGRNIFVTQFTSSVGRMCARVSKVELRLIQRDCKSCDRISFQIKDESYWNIWKPCRAVFALVRFSNSICELKNDRESLLVEDDTEERRRFFLLFFYYRYMAILSVTNIVQSNFWIPMKENIPKYYIFGVLDNEPKRVWSNFAYFPFATIEQIFLRIHH